MANLFGRTENFFSREYIFTSLVLLQALFGGKGLAGPLPQRLERVFDNPLVRLILLTAVSFTATKEIDTAIVVVCAFLALLWIIRTPEERKRSKLI